MSDVSCRAFSYFTAAEAKGLISIDALIEGVDVSRTTLADPDARVSWDVWAELCERFATALQSDEKLLGDTGDLVTSEGFAGYFGKTLGLLADVRELYELGARWVGPSLYHPAEFACERLDAASLRFHVRLRAGYRPCRPWFLMVQSAMISLPRYLGLPDAVVEVVRLSGTEIEVRVTPPPAPVARSMLRRLTTVLSAPGAIFDELAAQQGQLSRAHAQMRSSTRAFRNTLDALPYLVAVHDKGIERGVPRQPRAERARILYANPAFASFFGESPASVVGVELAHFFPGADRARLASWLDPTAHRVVVSRPQGDVTLEVRGFDSIEFEGHEAAVFHATRLTDAELERDRSEAALRGLLDAFPDVVLRFDRHRVLQSVHGAGGPEVSALRQRIGQRADQVLALFQWVDPAMNEAARSDFDRAFEGRQVVSRQVALPRPGGGVSELLVRYAPIGEELALIVHDETERRQVDRRLAVAERMASLGTLAAGVAHEINNPLTWVLANVEQLTAQLGATADRETLELLGEVRDGARRIAATVAGMKGFSRVDAKPKEPVSLEAVIQQAGRITQHELRHCARLVLELDDVPDVLAHDVELGQVFINLLVNAAHAMPPGASPATHAISVTLRAGAGDGTVVATVTDDGAGIPAEVRGRLFDPFVTTKAAGTGTGLGLAISRRIVEDCGGAIDVESRPGKTAFTLTFPAARPDAAPGPVASPPRAPRRLKVMVIDDEPLVGRSTARSLSACEVTLLSSASEALPKLLDGPLPDVVLCDLMMPGMSGIDLFERLEAAQPAAIARLIFMTGGTFTARAEEFLSGRSCRVLHKPFSSAELLKAVREVGEAQ